MLSKGSKVAVIVRVCRVETGTQQIEQQRTVNRGWGDVKQKLVSTFSNLKLNSTVSTHLHLPFCQLEFNLRRYRTGESMPWANTGGLLEQQWYLQLLYHTWTSDGVVQYFTQRTTQSRLSASPSSAAAASNKRTSRVCTPDAKNRIRNPDFLYLILSCTKPILVGDAVIVYCTSSRIWCLGLWLEKLEMAKMNLTWPTWTWCGQHYLDMANSIKK